MILLIKDYIFRGISQPHFMTGGYFNAACSVAPVEPHILALWDRGFLHLPATWGTTDHGDLELTDGTHQ